MGRRDRPGMEWTGQCDKVGFSSEGAAKAAVRRSQRHAHKKERLTVYRCLVCGYFHFGHQPDRLR